MSDYLRRLEDELVRAGYDRSLRARARRSPARPALAVTLAAAVLVAGGAGLVAVVRDVGGDAAHERPAKPPAVGALHVSVSPHTGGKHTRFIVTFTAPRAAGDLRQTRRTYIVRVQPAAPRAGCIEVREAYLRPTQAGTRVSARLAPSGGEGAGLGWCRGLFRGTVTYTEDFACPAHGRCQPPAGFRRHSQTLARFRFRVR